MATEITTTNQDITDDFILQVSGVREELQLLIAAVASQRMVRSDHGAAGGNTGVCSVAVGNVAVGKNNSTICKE